MLLGQRERLETTVVDFDRAVQLIRETVGALLDIVPSVNLPVVIPRCGASLLVLQRFRVRRAAGERTDTSRGVPSDSLVGRFRQFVTAGRVGLRSSANMASILDLISAVLIVPLCRGVCRPVGVVGANEVVAMCPAFVGYRYVCLTVTVVIWFTSWPTMLYTTCSVLCHSAWSRRSCPRMGQSGCWSANRLRLIPMAPSVELRGFGRSRWARDFGEASPNFSGLVAALPCSIVGSGSATSSGGCFSDAN